MKVLLIGSGGREDALAWALRRSDRVQRLCCTPGNAGIARHAECVPIGATDVPQLVEHARTERYDLTVVGPEAPLVDGLADQLRETGMAVFGASAAAARLEGSKIFAKQFMQRHDIPTAAFEVFDDSHKATAYLRDTNTRYPLVIKADGLAAGKGVLLPDTADEAVAIAKRILDERQFGDAGARIIVEERLTGREASFFVLSDGTRFVELETCQDYKRAEDGDRGLNTGGMGTYSPSVYLDDELKQRIRDRIVEPTIRGMAEEGHPYLGVLYVGVMLTKHGPKVLEYNARFGDPEAQVLLPRLDGDWCQVLHACATGSLSQVELRWTPRATVCVVMSSGGYPGGYATGHPIHGIEDAEALDDVIVFHAGTSSTADHPWVTSGGRVLGVTAWGDDLAAARARAYAAVDKIQWAEEHHRMDIAQDAVERIARGCAS